MCTKEKNFSVSSKRSQDCVAAASSFSSSSSQVLFKQQTQNCLLKFFFFSTIKKYQTFKAWNYLFLKEAASRISWDIGRNRIIFGHLVLCVVLGYFPEAVKQKLIPNCLPRPVCSPKMSNPGEIISICECGQCSSSNKQNKCTFLREIAEMHSEQELKKNLLQIEKFIRICKRNS